MRSHHWVNHSRILTVLVVSCCFSVRWHIVSWNQVVVVVCRLFGFVVGIPIALVQELIAVVVVIVVRDLMSDTTSTFCTVCLLRTDMGFMV